MKTFLLIIYFIILIGLVVTGVVFAKNNSYLVSLELFGHVWSPVPQWIIILVSFASGVVLSILIMSWELMKILISRRKYRRLYEQCKTELDRYKNTMPGQE